MDKKNNFSSFSEFYPYYLSQHQNEICQSLHMAGTFLVILCAFMFLLTWHWQWLLLLPFVGYGCAWIGHFFFEKNKPATFQYPLYSLMGDFVLFYQRLKTGGHVS